MNFVSLNRDAVINIFSIVIDAGILCALASMFMGSSFRIESKTEVAFRVYKAAGNVASGS